MAVIRRFSFQILTIVILFGCSGLGSTNTPSPDQTDRSPFTGIPCSAPCWHGLIIGHSSESDVMSTLQTLTFIDRSSIKVHQMQSLPSLDPNIWGQGVEVTADCANDTRQCLQIRVVENILTEVMTIMNYNIRVNEAIQYLADPNYIGFDRAGGEQMACKVYLIWKEKQLVLASQIFEGARAVENNCYALRDNGKVSSSLLVHEASYQSIRAIEDLLSSTAGEFFEFTDTTQ